MLVEAHVESLGVGASSVLAASCEEWPAPATCSLEADLLATAWRAALRFLPDPFAFAPAAGTLRRPDLAEEFCIYDPVEPTSLDDAVLEVASQAVPYPRLRRLHRGAVTNGPVGVSQVNAILNGPSGIEGLRLLQGAPLELGAQLVIRDLAMSTWPADKSFEPEGLIPLRLAYDYLSDREKAELEAVLLERLRWWPLVMWYKSAFILSGIPWSLP